MSVDADDLIQAICAGVPGMVVESIAPSGEGDYCQAYVVNGEWIFLVAKHDEASRSLERTAALLPHMAPTLSLIIPTIAHIGWLSAPRRAFVGYPQVPGIELTTERWRTFSERSQEHCAADLADFLHGMHSFPVDAAQHAGVVTCAYPFGVTEDGITEGTAEEGYRRDLERVLSSSVLDGALRASCRRIVDQHVRDHAAEERPVALLHGEVSHDHVLFDVATNRITGVIDFNGVVIGDPVRDLLYLSEDYGMPLVERLLHHYPVGDLQSVLAKLHFFRQWHAVLRLLWALDHRHPEGVARRMGEVRALMTHDAASWR